MPDKGFPCINSSEAQEDLTGGGRGSHLLLHLVLTQFKLTYRPKVNDYDPIMQVVIEYSISLFYILYDMHQRLLSSAIQFLSMSSSTPMYDVFLSFRGENTRVRTFVRHLDRSLADKGIVTFIDKILMIGESHLRVIRESKTAIVVISENYASSPSCLDELAEIVKLQRNGTLMVLPVYYGVNPCDVSRQSGDFGQKFRKILSKNPDKLQKWTDALTKFGSISGIDYRYLLVPLSYEFRFCGFLLPYMAFIFLPQ